MSSPSEFRFPCSFAQQRLWFLDQCEPSTDLYNIPAAWSLYGMVSETSLQAALNGLVARHESLRTRFDVEDGVPLQVIDAQGELRLRIVTMDGAQDGASNLAEVIAAIRQEASEPFFLAEGPLARALLVRQAPDRYVLSLTFHHIIFDGWSMGVLTQELSTLYNASSRGNEAQLEPLPIQYADFAHWQREQQKSPSLKRQLDYWRNKLLGVSSELNLPIDHIRPAKLGHAGGAVDFELKASVCERLKQFASAQHASLFMLMAAAFNVLLFRYCHQEDVCIGYPVSNRNRTETRGLIGFFANTLVLRSTLQSQQTFLSLLNQIRNNILDANECQDLPFDRLVELQSQRSPNRSQIFQVMLSLFEEGEGGGLDLCGVKASIIPAKTSCAKFELSLGLTARGGRLFGEFEYNVQLFSRGTIERLARHLTTLLEAAVQSPQTRLCDLPLLDDAERQTVLIDWNRSRSILTGVRCIHERVEEQARCSSNAAAVVCGELSLSYGDLNARANQLAHFLRGWGVGPDTLVGLCLERGFDMVISLVAILKAGGAYVPLDPDYPCNRLSHMLLDTAAPVLITHAALADQLPASQARLLLLDEAWLQIGQMDGSDLPALATPDHLAYCIYTSGSTGQPKGALNTHGSLANLADWYFSGDLAAEGERVLLASSLSFDLTQKNVLGTLAKGGTLIIPDGHLTDLNALGEAVRRHSPTRINCAPSAYRVFMDALGMGTLRTVVLGGEPIGIALADEIADRGARLVNSYGPTECADVAVSYQRCQCAKSKPIPLGRPLPGVQVYVLDDQLRPTPIGTQGELCIAGIGVGRGYLNRPDLTAEKFVPNPFGEPGSRMYRTGDRARWLSDGNLEFMGRIDHQVKIRGFRIELGEIETALLQCKGVKEAVVIVREDELDDKQLVGYVIAPGVAIDSLREQLQRRLPEYMIPTAWVKLNALPLSSSGKVDRNALPQPSCAETSSTVGYLPPCTPTEELLVSIWGEVLKIERVGVENDFFLLGGHSISAARVTYRANKALQVTLGVGSMFKLRTVRSLAAYIDTIPVQTSPPPLPPIFVEVKKYPLSPGQEWLWEYYLLNALVGGRNILPVCLELIGDEVLAAAEIALQRLVSRHSVLNTRIRWSADDVGRIECCEDNQMIPLKVIRLDLDRVSKQLSIDRMIEDSLREPFDLVGNPLIRASLYLFPNSHGILVLALHHFVSDGWSLSVVKDDLARLLNAVASDVPEQRKEVRHYRDYALNAVRCLEAGQLDSHFAYWTKYLRDSPGFLRINGEHDRPARFDFNGACLSATIPSHIVAGIDRVCRAEGATDYMLLMAGYLLALHRLTGSADVIVRSPVSTRGSIEEENSVGFYMQSIVIRSKCDTPPKPLALFRTVVADVRRALSYSAVPPLHLARSVGDNSDPAYCSRFQYLFNHHNFFQDIPGLQDNRFSVRDYAVSMTAPPDAKFDISISSVRRGADILYQIAYYRSAFSEASIIKFSEAFTLALGDIVWLERDDLEVT